MKNHGQAFLEQLARLPSDSFESRFSKSSTLLGLGAVLSRNELTLLYEAAFRAALCNSAINGLGAGHGKIAPEQEGTRSRLEREFMEARDILYASPGWQTLQEPEQTQIQRIFLSVLVAEDRLG